MSEEKGELAPRNTTQAAIEQVILKGDLRILTETERLQYNFAVCRSLGLNPHLRPIDYIVNDGKMSLYVNAIGIAQLRDLHGISTQIVRNQKDSEFVYCTARASKADRSEEATAIVPLIDKYNKPLRGQAKANAMMKAETKAKRRATLALCGIPWGDSGNVRTSRAYDIPDDLLPEEDLEF